MLQHRQEWRWDACGPCEERGLVTLTVNSMSFWFPARLRLFQHTLGLSVWLPRSLLAQGIPRKWLCCWLIVRVLKNMPPSTHPPSLISLSPLHPRPPYPLPTFAEFDKCIMRFEWRERWGRGGEEEETLQSFGDWDLVHAVLWSGRSQNGHLASWRCHLSGL